MTSFMKNCHSTKNADREKLVLVLEVGGSFSLCLFYVVFLFHREQKSYSENSKYLSQSLFVL